MFYLIYKVTNLVNNKEYIGSHKTENIDDGYMGSGKYLKRAIEKHGLESFRKDILFVYDNPDEMYRKEGELVNEDYLTNTNTYNLKIGGFGGWDHVNKNVILRISKNQKAANSTRKKYKNLLKSWAKQGGTNNFLKNGLNINFKKSSKNSMFGKKHTTETKEKIGKSNSIKQKGNLNSQYGKMWITDGLNNKLIKKTNEIPLGWKKGRILNI